MNEAYLVCPKCGSEDSGQKVAHLLAKARKVNGQQRGNLRIRQHALGCTLALGVAMALFYAC